MKPLKGIVIGMLGVLLLCSVSNAQTDTWQEGVSDEGTYMYGAVANANGDVFGEFCYYASRMCLWQMAVETSCTDNATAPVLANTETGTAVLTVQCDGKLKTGSYRYKYNWKDLESAIKGSKTLGIAMALNANGFKVYRFSLDGYLAAQSKLETKFFGSLPPAKPAAKPAAEVL